MFLQSHSLWKKTCFSITIFIYIIYIDLYAGKKDRCINVSAQDVHYLANALKTSSNVKYRRDKKSQKYNSAKFYELKQRFLKYTESGKSKYVTGGSVI